MKRYLKLIGAALLFSAILITPVQADWWVKGADGGLYTNGGNGLANSPIHVAACYIGTGTGTSCGGGGGGTIGGTIAATQVAYGSALNTIQGDALFTRNLSTQYTNIFAPLDITGTPVGFTIANNVFGFPINGTALTNTPSGGFSGFFTGDATGAGGDNVSNFIVSNNGINNATFSLNAGFGIKLDPGSQPLIFQHDIWPASDGSSGQAIVTDGAGNLSFATIGGGSPGGSDQDIQFNQSGAFGGDSHLQWDYTNANFIVGSAGQTQLNVNNSTQSITATTPSFNLTNGTGNYAIEANVGSSSNSVVLGDASSTGNGNNFTVDDGGQNILAQLGNLGNFRVSQAGNTFFNVNPNSQIFQLGDVGATANSGMVVVVDNSSMANIAWGATTGNGTFANLGDQTRSLTINATNQEARINLNNSVITPGLLAQWNYGLDAVFQVDGADRGMTVGDLDGGNNNTLFHLDDSSSHITFQLPSTGVFNIQDPSLNPVFQVATGAGTSAVSIGDIAGVGNHTTSVLNDSSQTITSIIGNRYSVEDTSSNPVFTISTNPSFYGQVKMGDINGVVNSTRLFVNDNTTLIQAQTAGAFLIGRPAGSIWFKFDSTSSLIQIGDIDGVGNSTLFTADDIAGTNTMQQGVDFFVQDISGVKDFTVDIPTDTSTFRGAIANTPQYAAPTTGGTVTSNGTTQMILDPAGALLAVTIVLPPSPINGQMFWVTSTKAITGTTFSGGTVVGNPAGFTVGGGQRYVYSTTASEWIAN